MVQCHSDHCESSLNVLTGVSFLESHLTIKRGMSVCVILLRTTLSIWCYFGTPDLQRSGFITLQTEAGPARDPSPVISWGSRH